MNSTKIVIAEDMEPILFYLEKVISDVEEFEVVGKAKNGKELIDLVVKDKPELVITDIEMPECSGTQAVEEINKLGIKTKYIVVTGNSNFIITPRQKEMGMLKVIQKPILDDKKFIQQMRAVLNQEFEVKATKEITEQETKVQNKKENIITRIINKIFGNKTNT